MASQTQLVFSLKVCILTKVDFLIEGGIISFLSSPLLSFPSVSFPLLFLSVFLVQKRV